MQKIIVPAILLILPVCAVFWPAGCADFVLWDDDYNIYENPLLNPPSFENTLRFWKAPYIYLYVPLTYTVWSAAAAASYWMTGGLRPEVFHIVNLIFHLGNTLLVRSILTLLLSTDRRSGSDAQTASIFGSLLYAVHPVQVEPVAWATGLKDVLGGTFALSAILLYLRAAHHPNGRMNGMPEIGRTVVFMMALLSKPSTVVVPALAFILDYFICRRPFKRICRDLWVWFALSSVCIAATAAIQPMNMNEWITPLWARPFVAMDALSFYIYKLVYPAVLTIDYGRHPEAVLADGTAFLTSTAVILLPLTCRQYLKKADRVCWAGGALFICALSPVLGLVPFHFQNYSTVADRYLYLPMLAPALILSSVICRNMEKRWVQSACLAVLLTLGLKSFWQVQRWQDSLTLFQHALAVNSESSGLHYNIALSYSEKGNFDMTKKHLRRAIAIDPEYSEAYNHFGNLYFVQDDMDRAVKYYRRAVELEPEYEEAHLNLGAALTRKGRYREALEHFGMTLYLNPDNPDARHNHEKIRRYLDK